MEEGEAGLAQPIMRQAAQTEGYEPLALHSQVSACGTNCRTAELPLALHSHESARGVKLGDRIPRASTAPAANFSRVNMDVSSTFLRWHRPAHPSPNYQVLRCCLICIRRFPPALWGFSLQLRLFLIVAGEATYCSTAPASRPVR